MGKYLLVLALVAVYVYVCVVSPKDAQIATGGYELVQLQNLQLQNPLIPPANGNKAK
jgi:hypothetical protein